MAFNTDWWAALVTLMDATLPDCDSTTIFHSFQINRVDFRQSRNGGLLPLPYYVVHTLNQEDAPEYGLDNITYWQPLEIYGVFAANDPLASIGGGGFDIQLYVEGVAGLIQRALINYQGPYFQANIKRPIIDISDELEPNAIFLRNNTPCFAFGLGARLLVGEQA